MTDRPANRDPRPLPADWLPNPSPREDSAAWRHLRDRIVENAAGELSRLSPGRATEDATWYGIMAAWSRPAAAMAAAAALLLVIGQRAPRPQQPADSLPLSVLAAGGEPYALWHGVGTEADPVLALIAIELSGQ
jgi:hypothetical protein